MCWVLRHNGGQSRCDHRNWQFILPSTLSLPLCHKQEIIATTTPHQFLSFDTVLGPSLQPPETTEMPTAPGSQVSAGDSEKFFLGREAANRNCSGQWVPLLLLPGPLQE